MEWRDVSEINFGRLVEGKVSPTRFTDKMFFPPYDRAFDFLNNGKSKAEIIREIGLDHFQSALKAAKRVNGAGDVADFAELLESSAARFRAADDLSRVVDKLRKNKEPNWAMLNKIAADAQSGMVGKFKTLDEVWDEEPQPHWQKSGIAFLDKWLGGLPKYGLVTVGGRPKVGKTTFGMSLAVGYVKEHSDKQVVIFTVEMMILEFKDRLRELEMSGKLTKSQRKRIILCEEQVTPEQTINWSASIPDLGLIITDFADLIIQGEISEPKMTAMYRTLSLGAKSLKACYVLMAQLSGGYQGGIPRPYHIRYTRLAEALVVLQLMLYVPWSDWFEPKDQEILPHTLDSGYVIKWMSRFKTRKCVGVPHAILVDFDGANGWNIEDEGEHYSLEN